MSSSFPLDGMRVRFAGDSNVGMKRAHNEDSFYLPESERLAIVADGMGGHASGEVASRMAVDTIVGFFKATMDDQQLTWPFKMDHGHRYDINRMVTAIKLANLKIHEQAQKDPRCHGMGTTVVSTLFLDRALIVGHVGDSRLYRRRDGVMKQLTEDHSLLNDYIKMKNLSADEIAAFPHKNVIVRALGMKDTVQVDVHVDKPALDDLYIICSDGLTGMVKDEEIEAIADQRRRHGRRVREADHDREQERRPRQHHRRRRPRRARVDRARLDLADRDDCVGHDDGVGDIAGDGGAGPDDGALDARAGSDARAGAEHDIRPDFGASLDGGAGGDAAGGGDARAGGDRRARVDADQRPGRIGEQARVAKQRDVAGQVALRRRVFGEVAGERDGRDGLASEQGRDVGVADDVAHDRPQAIEQRRRQDVNAGEHPLGHGAFGRAR